MGDGDGRGVRPGLRAPGVEQGRPRGRARLQGGDEGVGPAGHHLVGVLAPPGGVAEGAGVAAPGVWSQPGGHVDGEHDPPARAAGQTAGRDRAPQAARVEVSPVQGAYREWCERRCSAARAGSTRARTGPDRRYTARRPTARTGCLRGEASWRTSPSERRTVPRLPAGDRLHGRHSTTTTSVTAVRLDIARRGTEVVAVSRRSPCG